jgi:hypothetical protein
MQDNVVIKGKTVGPILLTESDYQKEEEEDEEGEEEE